MGQTIASSPLQVARKTITFDGTANTGAVGAVPIFTVTGEVIVDKVIPYCTTLLTEGGATATLALGVTGSVALFIAATNGVNIDANEFWVDTAPDSNGVALPAALQNIIITDNIIGTVAVDTVDTGVIEFTVYYRAISTDGAVA